MSNKNSRVRNMLRMKKANKRKARENRKQAQTGQREKSCNNIPPSTEISKEAFASVFISYCKEHYGTSDLYYDAESSSIKNRTGKRIEHYLHNIYADYCSAKPEYRINVLSDYAKIWHTDFSYPTSYAAAKDRIFPIIQCRPHQPNVSDNSDNVCRPLTDRLCIGIVYDLDLAEIHIGKNMLHEWGVDADTLFQTAIDNLRASFNKRVSKKSIHIKTFAEQTGIPADQLISMMHQASGVEEAERIGFTIDSTYVSPLSFEDVGFGEFINVPGLYTYIANDWSGFSSILIPEWIGALQVQGDPIVMRTHSDDLLVTGSENINGLKRMALIAKEAAGGHPLSKIPIRLTAQGWETYQLDPSHPAYPIFHELYSIEIADCYNRQKDVLQKTYPGFVATCSLFQHAGTVESKCVWAKQVDNSLLPKSDYVFFISLDSSKEQVEVILLVPWDDVFRIVGHRMVLSDEMPPRYSVTSFPSDDELAQLASKAIVKAA